MIKCCSSIVLFLVLFCPARLSAQHSVARLWNEILLDGIGKDLARPPVQARNLFHLSAAMYDAWAVYDPTADTYFLGKTVHGFQVPFHRFPLPADLKAAQQEAVSFAAYRILKERFEKSAASTYMFPLMDALMDSLGYNTNITSSNYLAGPAQMGNYIAREIIEYGLADGANESGDYANQYYKPVNNPLNISVPGNPGILDINRWQPLKLNQFVDQNGNPLPNSTPPFQSPEWGNVFPFALQENEDHQYMRDGHLYHVYHDPGPQPLLDTAAVGGLSEEFKWNYELVAIWSSLLDPSDSVKIDISPASQGNNSLSDYPVDVPGLRDFYDLFHGGDISSGHAVNPKTGAPYAPEWVYRGDFARVLAEFWADGPKSETPPGHWFSILNYVNDQPGSSRQIGGSGTVCSDLEWDVKAYFMLGGAMHDAAITAWGIKGWYDSGRPVTILRAMAERGQSSDPSLPRYHPAGLLLYPGYVELIQPGDSLAGPQGEYVNDIKFKAWKGPNYIKNPANDEAGVGWVRAKEWYPYQRPTFVTPPFAGYISGHSTYSRAGAEVLTALTGDPFFPGGMGRFYCKKNEYLVFEDGPSTDVTLQWATYRDAADQCSLSRIYGGIHPPLDDMPGRLIGLQIGQEAVAYAEKYFSGKTPPAPVAELNVFPNPTKSSVLIEMPDVSELSIRITSADGKLVQESQIEFTNGQAILNLEHIPPGIYLITALDSAGKRVFVGKLVKI